MCRVERACRGCLVLDLGSKPGCRCYRRSGGAKDNLLRPGSARQARREPSRYACSCLQANEPGRSHGRTAAADGGVAANRIVKMMVRVRGCTAATGGSWNAVGALRADASSLSHCRLVRVRLVRAPPDLPPRMQRDPLLPRSARKADLPLPVFVLAWTARCVVSLAWPDLVGHAYCSLARSLVGPRTARGRGRRGDTVRSSRLMKTPLCWVCSPSASAPCFFCAANRAFGSSCPAPERARRSMC